MDRRDRIDQNVEGRQLHGRLAHEIVDCRLRGDIRIAGKRLGAQAGNRRGHDDPAPPAPLHVAAGRTHGCEDTIEIHPKRSVPAAISTFLGTGFEHSLGNRQSDTARGSSDEDPLATQIE